MAAKPRRRGVFSRSSALRATDGRLVEARVMAEVARELTDQLGGERRVTAAQRLVVHATSLLALRLRAAAERYVTGQGDVESLDRHVVAVQSAMVRNLVVLGLDQAPRSETPTLAQYLEARRVA